MSQHCTDDSNAQVVPPTVQRPDSTSRPLPNVSGMNLSADFRLLFEQAPGSYLVLSTDFVIIDASDAYLDATMTERQLIVGRHLFDVFPDNPQDPEANGVSNVRASLEQVLASRRPHRMALQKYDIRRPAAAGGGFEERYWSPLNSPVIAADGAIACILLSAEDVTELVLSQRKESAQGEVIRKLATRAERRYAQLLDTAPDAIVVVGDDGLIDLVNAQTEKLFGYTREQLVGNPLELLLPEASRAGHGVHLARFFEKPGARPMGSGIELFGLRKDQVQIPIEVSLSPLKTDAGMTVSAAIRDISERKRTEAAAKLSADRLVSALESMQDAVALFDEADCLVLCNSCYRRFLGGGVDDDWVGLPYERLLDAWLAQTDLASGDSREEFRAFCLRERHSRPTSHDFRTIDGRKLRMTSRPTPEGGVVDVVWDLTEDERSAEALRVARAEAEAASESKSEFLSSMSHELRTPLNAILGFAQLVKRDKREPVSARNQERLAHILQGGEHLLRLIDDILDLSRIEAGRVSVSIEPVDLRETLTEVQTTLAEDAARLGIRVETGVGRGDPLWVTADRVRLAQILMNFGSNAIKYNRPGGHVRWLVTKSERSTVRVTVEDSGIGIPLEKQAKLFQPFERAGQEAGPIQGTGIGLVITRKLAQVMAGDVGFCSEPGVGSSFWVDIPLYTSALRARPTEQVTHAVRSFPLDGTERVVLYVEDNPANVAFMEDLIGCIQDLRLVTRKTAEEGLTAAFSLRPKAILMDINLPGMSGVDALRTLRSSSHTKDIPVIALTAAASERDQHNAQEHSRFDRYLTKPVRVEELLAVLESVLA